MLTLWEYYGPSGTGSEQAACIDSATLSGASAIRDYAGLNIQFIFESDASRSDGTILSCLERDEKRKCEQLPCLRVTVSCLEVEVVSSFARWKCECGIIHRTFQSERRVYCFDESDVYKIDMAEVMA